MSIANAWFTIGGWVAFMVLAAWHWRTQVSAAACWLLDTEEPTPIYEAAPARHVRLVSQSNEGVLDPRDLRPRGATWPVTH
jgi:hypothetical protein